MHASQWAMRAKVAMRRRRTAAPYSEYLSIFLATLTRRRSRAVFRRPMRVVVCCLGRKHCKAQLETKQKHYSIASTGTKLRWNINLFFYHRENRLMFINFFRKLKILSSSWPFKLQWLHGPRGMEFIIIINVDYFGRCDFVMLGRYSSSEQRHAQGLINRTRYTEPRIIFSIDGVLSQCFVRGPMSCIQAYIFACLSLYSLVMIHHISNGCSD